MKTFRNIAVSLTLLALSASAFAHEAETAAESHPASNIPGFTNWPLIKIVLLATLWLFVAAIILGPLIKWLIGGDLWQRKNNQPFADDGGDHHAPAAHAPSHH